MTTRTTAGDRPRSPLDLRTVYLALDRDGGSGVEPATGPPPEVDGYTVGIAAMSEPPPHLGEQHLDGDELLYVIDGTVEVILEEARGSATHTVRAGEAFVVPRGVWHRVLPLGATELLYVTPGPNNHHRPAPSTTSA